MFAHFRTWKHAACVGLRHARMNASVVLFPFSGGCCCVLKSLRTLLVQDPATVHCGQRYDRKAGVSPCCQVAEISATKLKYILAKENTACYGSIIRVFTIIGILMSVSASLWSRNLGKTCLQEGRHPYSDTHACLLLKRRMHGKSDTEA